MITVAPAMSGAVPPGGYRLCAVDLDGTLLSWRTAADRAAECSATPMVSPANVAALQRVARDTATIVVVATGRGPASATRVADDVLGLGCPLVCNNGACVLSAALPSEDTCSSATTSAGAPALQRRTLIHASFYARDFVAGCCSAASDVVGGALICVYHPSATASSGCGISFCGSVPASVHASSINVMVCADEFPVVDEPRLSAAQREIVGNTRNTLHPYQSYDELARSEVAASCWKLLIWCAGEVRDALQLEIEKRLRPTERGIQLHRPETMLLEFVPPATNKAVGLQKLLNSLDDIAEQAAGASAAVGVSGNSEARKGGGAELRQNLLCFGDGDNDAEMLRSAAMGIAPSNSGAAAQGAATRVSEWAHYEDAVAQEIASLYGWQAPE